MSFTFNPSAGETESSSAVDLRRRLAAAMLQQGMQTSPIQSPWQGAARLSEALMGGLAVRRQAQQEQDANAQIMSAITGQPYTPPAQSGGFLSKLFGDNSVPASSAQQQVASTSPSPTDAADSTSAPTGGMSNYQGAISSIESGGNYGEIGPRSPTMGRALGKYQVMEANVGPWSQEALGRAVTPDEFLANPKIQDAIFDHKFGQYVQKFGPSGAAQAWFAGPGGVGKLNRRDSLGTSVAAYTNKFNSALGPAPTQIASLDPSAGLASSIPASGSQPIVPPTSPDIQSGDRATISPTQMQTALGHQQTSGYVDPTVTIAYRQPAPASLAAQAIQQQLTPEQIASGNSMAAIPVSGQQAGGPNALPFTPTADPQRDAAIPVGLDGQLVVPAGPLGPEHSYQSGANMPLNTGIDQPGAMQAAPNMPIDPTQVASLGPQNAQSPAPVGNEALPAPTGLPITGAPMTSATSAAMPAAQTAIPSPAPLAGQPSAAAPDQTSPRAQLAQAMMGAPGAAPNAIANNPRAQALLQAMMNPYASPQARAMAGAVLQTQMQPHTQIVQNPNTGATYLVDTWTGAKQLIDQGMTADSELEKDANNNPIGIFNKRTGTYQKMGDPSAQLEILPRPDGSVITVNKITGEQVSQPATAMKTDSIVEGPVDPQTGYPTKLLWNPVDGIKGVVGPNGQLLPAGSQQTQQAGNVPIPPPGVDPKKYRETLATRAAEANTPSAKDESEFAASMMARPSYKEYSAAVPTWNSFTQHIQDNTPAADKAIVDDFAKILNPGRAVTTGSFQLNMDAQSVPEYLQGQILKAFTGNGELGADARAQMAKIAQLKMQEYQKAWNIDSQQGTKIAKSHGLAVENVIPDVPGVEGIDFSKVNSLKTTAEGTGPASAAPISPEVATPAVAPATMPTATGPNGEKIQWNGSAWIPLPASSTVNPNSNVNRIPTGN